MKVVAIDFGKVRVGVAVSDELGMLAHPRPFLDGTHLKPLLAALTKLATDEQAGRFIVGLPRNLDGSEGPAARRARSFARVLGEASQLPIELVDEWLSSKQAHARLAEQGLDSRRARQRVDSAAAAVFLQTWLDRQRLTRASSDDPWT